MIPTSNRKLLGIHSNLLLQCQTDRLRSTRQPFNLIRLTQHGRHIVRYERGWQICAQHTERRRYTLRTCSIVFENKRIPCEISHRLRVPSIRAIVNKALHDREILKRSQKSRILWSSKQCYLPRRRSLP